MAIEIVKNGCKKFNMTCPNCGCEFTYEYEDVEVGVVICPSIKLPDWSVVSDCEGCPNNPKYLKTPYIGDSPCQFCAKNPNKITCTSGGSNV